MAKKKTKKKAKKVKKPAKKKSSAKKKKSVKSKAKKKLKPKKRGLLSSEGEFVGKVTHYFPHVKAAVLVLKKGNLKLGDKILIKGHTTNFYEQISSMQIDRAPIQSAKKGDEIGLFVKDRTRAGDEVYLIK